MIFKCKPTTLNLKSFQSNQLQTKPNQCIVSSFTRSFKFCSSFVRRCWFSLAQQHFYYALVKNIFIIFQKLLKEINLNGSYLSPIISMWVESYLFFKYNQQTNQPIPTNQKDGKSKKIGKFVIVRLVQVSQRLLNVMTSLVYVHWYILNRYKQKVCCFCVISKKYIVIKKLHENHRIQQFMKSF